MRRQDRIQRAVSGVGGSLLAGAPVPARTLQIDVAEGGSKAQRVIALVEVRQLTQGAPYGIALTEREKEMLRQVGKITREEIMNAEVNDMPPRHRLACQCFVRNEDIFVSFEGDKTLPAKGPALSIAAAIYKGGVKIGTLDEFLSYAVKVEEDAAVHFEHLGKVMEACGNKDVAELFRQLGSYSRLHLQEAKAKAAAIYKGGVKIGTLDEFLSYAVKVEEYAAVHFHLDGIAQKL